MDDLGFAPGSLPFRAAVGPGVAERGNRGRRFQQRLEGCAAAARATCRWRWLGIPGGPQQLDGSWNILL